MNPEDGTAKLSGTARCRPLMPGRRYSPGSETRLRTGFPVSKPLIPLHPGPATSVTAGRLAGRGGPWEAGVAGVPVRRMAAVRSAGGLSGCGARNNRPCEASLEIDRSLRIEGYVQRGVRGPAARVGAIFSRSPSALQVSNFWSVIQP